MIQTKHRFISRVASFIIMFVFVLMTASTIYAYNVGDSVTFTSGEIKSSSNGNTTQVTRTEEQKRMDSANLSNNRFVSDIFTNIVKTVDKNAIRQYVKNNDGIAFIQNISVPRGTLEQIANLRNSYFPGGYYFDIENKGGNQTVDSLNGEQYNALFNLALQRGFGSIYSAQALGEIILDFNGFMSPEELLDFFNKLYVLNGKIVRKSPSGGFDIIDFDNYITRYKALNMYLQACSGEDVIETEYIIEIKVNSMADTVLWSSIPQTWGSTRQTHFWEFECLDSYDGNYHAAMTQFAGNTVNQMFYFPGQYHVTATQILNQQYYNAISYDINEYWVVAETGQVIYKSESTGAAIPTDNETPLEELNLFQVSNYQLVDNGTYYIPVYDSMVEVTRTSTPDASMGGVPGVWGYTFTTQRIE